MKKFQFSLGRMRDYRERLLEEEKGTIQKYRQQMLWIRDNNVQANLQRIIEDEEVHVRLLTDLLAAYGPNQDLDFGLQTKAIR